MLECICSLPVHSKHSHNHSHAEERQTGLPTLDASMTSVTDSAGYKDQFYPPKQQVNLQYWVQFDIKSLQNTSG
ncbi:hypothetical protein SKAU_G00282490 [Synaphobranchus kaupii]|uniref:Uncharacterized protein n=1 Tax=Synaphobranchus kaupii TaxID=118154 RepID=A0A9Q1EXB3_SYNKA|nr:hypothetical protein SKAU_G00282490 [Synaphobranchus kaupii]